MSNKVRVLRLVRQLQRACSRGVLQQHCKTLEAVFLDPVLASLDWSAMESLLVAVGCTVAEGTDSRVRFMKNDAVETFYRPHPAKEAKRYQVRAARTFLERIKVRP